MSRFYKLGIFVVVLTYIMSCSILLAYNRAVESVEKDNVKNKIFTKTRKIEISGPDFGGFLNQALINSYVIHGGLFFYKDEMWGFGIEGGYVMNFDKAERKCLEEFYNDPKDEIIAECAPEDNDPSQFINSPDTTYRPIYMPIREIQYFVAGNVSWNPVYGKQIVLLSYTSYFDFFINLGGGAIFSIFYPKSEVLRNGVIAQCSLDLDTGTTQQNCGAKKNETDLIGAQGRPDPQSQIHPFFTAGIGNKFHLTKNISLKLELRDFLILGTSPSPFENLLAVWGGINLRF